MEWMLSSAKLLFFSQNYLLLSPVCQPNGPVMVMDYWTGWYDVWGDLHHVLPPEGRAVFLCHLWILKMPHVPCNHHSSSHLNPFIYLPVTILQISQYFPLPSPSAIFELTSLTAAINKFLSNSLVSITSIFLAFNFA